MKKVVITGALGYLGSKLVENLLERFPEIEIIAIDDLSSGNLALLTLESWSRVNFVRSDILTADLPACFEGAEVVFHLAALADSSGSFENADPVYKVNSEGAKQAAAACLQTGSFLIFPSTTSIYAKPSGIVFENEASRWFGPQTPYADSKKRAEDFLNGLKEKGLNCSALRLGTLFGISKGMHTRTAVQKFCREAVLTGKVTVWESALYQVRPYCEVEDAANAMIFTAANRANSEEVVHAATEHATVSQLIGYLKTFIPKLEVLTVKHKAMNHFSYEVSCAHLMQQGFQFQGSLRRSMEDLIDYFSLVKDSEILSAGIGPQFR